MSTYTESKIITLTSQSATAKRNGSYLSNVWYDLGSFIKDEPDIIHKQVTLLSAQIPYSFYVVNYTNNTLVFKISTDPTFTSVTIPVGNYNGNSLCNVLKTLFLNNLGLTVTCALSSINGIITITSSIVNFTISSTSTCLAILGFESSTTYASTANVLTAPYPLNLLGIKILQVRSSAFNMLNYSSINNGITTLLATIPVSAVPFGMIDYVDKGGSGITFTNSSLDEIDIEILDGESGAFINFNNQDWTMTVLITLLRTTETVNRPTFERGVMPVPEPMNLEKPVEQKKPKNKDLQDIELLSS
jgi:hypothetical protein